jgi:hypothetical protein
LTVAEQRGPAVEKTADLSLILVVINTGGRDGSDGAVIVLEPVVIDGDADLIVTVDCRCPLMDHDCPEDIGLTAALLLQLLQSLINPTDLPFCLLRLTLNRLQLLLQVSCGSGKSSLAERVIDLSDRRAAYVWLG